MDDMGLRGRLRRGPWVAGSDLNNVFQQLDAVGTEPMGIAQDIGMPPWQASRIQTGLENHNFRDDPPDTSANLNDVTNKLPGWSFKQASGTAITAKWVADASSGSGGVIRFDVASGASGDHSYIEQIVTVASSRALTWSVWGIASFINRSASRSFTIWGEAQALKSDGTATGTPVAFSTAWSSLDYTDEQITVPQSSGMLPSDAQFIRFRIGVKRDAALTSDTGTIDLAETRLLEAQAYGVFPDQASAGTRNPAVMTQVSGALYIHNALDPTKVATPGADSATYPYIKLPSTTVSPFPPPTITNPRTLSGALGTNGWAHMAFPLGAGPDSVSTTTNVLTNQYDALLVPIPITAPMKIRSVTVRQGIADGTTRNFTSYLACQAELDSTDLVIICSFTNGSYTASAASNQTAAVDGATGYVLVEPGMYWVCVQNVHATRSHATRVVGGGDWSPSTAATSTTIGDLSGETVIDTTVFATHISNIPMVRLNGEVWDEGSAF